MRETANGMDCVEINGGEINNPSPGFQYYEQFIID